MTICPKAEHCLACGAEAPEEWVPPILCAGKPLPGTGEWRSALTDGRCPPCHEEIRREIEERQRQLALRLRLIALGRGEKPYREFRFDSFEVTPGNQLAFVRAQGFNPQRDNLYLWGACGVGKTHLAFALARRFCEKGDSVEFLKPPQLMRQVRRKDPDEEQHAIDRFIRAEVFVLDDLGIGHETAYARQIFQEILDGRDFSYRSGLVATSKYSLGDLAAKLDDDTISSRLAGMCQVIEIKESDHRLRTHSATVPALVVPSVTKEPARNVT